MAVWLPASRLILNSQKNWCCKFSYTNLFNNKLYVQVTNAKQYRCKGAQRHQQLANLLRYSMKKKKQRRRFHASCQLSIKLLKSVDSCHPHFKLCMRVWHDLCSMCLFNNSISTLNMNVTSFGLHCISNNFNYSPSNFPHITLSSRRFFFNWIRLFFSVPIWYDHYLRAQLFVAVHFANHFGWGICVQLLPWII